METGAMRIVYDLRTDLATVRSMQQVSRSSGTDGLRDTHGLVGSPAWWTAIEEGRLQVHAASGTITGFWPGQWGDGPAEFQVTTPDGDERTWLCHQHPMLAEVEFRLGRAVEVRWVVQERKTPFAGKTTTRVEIAILLGP